MSPCRVVHKPNYFNIQFFSLVSLLTLAGLPLYAWRIGISPAEWRLFAVFVIATGFSITVGYHRLFAHRSFKANRLIRLLCLIFGAAAFEQSALMWSSQHRDHHRYVDTENDPYNIKKGFWYAHMGWMLFWRQKTDYSNVRDLAADPLILHQHNNYLLWAAGAGVLLPLAIGAAMGHLLGSLLLVVAARICFVHHSTFSINSICHTFGRATYDINSTARDHWVVALITNGEGYHNFHHRFASDYRNGVRWYQWDPSKWAIALLCRAGLAKDPYRTSPHMILAARVAAERQRVERELGEPKRPEVAALLATLAERYRQLKDALYEWEHVEKEYCRLRQAVVEQSQAYLAKLKTQVAERRQAFFSMRRQWISLINTNPLIPRIAHI